MVSHIAGKNINLPILGNVLIQCGENKTLRFSTTNLEIAVNCLVRGKVEETGDVTVPSRLFADYVSLLPKDRVDVSSENNTVTVACGSYQTKLNGIAASEFPLIPTVDKKSSLQLKVSDFRQAVSQVLFAVAPNESRPEISGVYFKFVPESDGRISLILAATDSYRLAERRLAVIKDSSSELKESVSVIVPARTVAEMVRILGLFKDGIGMEENLEIGLGESQVVFSYDNVEMISRVIEGRYPDYRQLIPESFETEVLIQKSDLQRAVKTASLFSRTGLNDVNVKISEDGKINLSANNSQTGEHAVDLEGAVKGKGNQVTLNFKYLLDGINNIESDSLAVQMVDGNSPVMVSPTGGESEGEGDEDKGFDYLYIVMPIRQ